MTQRHWIAAVIIYLSVGLGLWLGQTWWGVESPYRELGALCWPILLFALIFMKDKAGTYRRR